MSRLCRDALVLICLTTPGLAFADWDFFPALRVAADLDDNATLTSRTDDIDDISGIIGEASVEIVYQSETGLFSILPVLRSRRYDGDVDHDSDDQFLSFRMRHNGKSNTFSLRGSYSHESVRTAELADANLDTDIDPDEIEDDDSGRVDLDQRREKFRLVPRWSARLSDVSTVAADVNFLVTEYDDSSQPVVELTDYNDTRARLFYRRNLSSRHTAVIVATARNYHTDFLSGDFKGYGLSAGTHSALSETSVLRAIIGVETVEQAGGLDESKVVADISVVRRQETTQFLAQFRSRISPSGRGRLAERDEVNLRITRDLTDKFAAGIGARGYRSRSVGRTIDNDVSFVQLNAQLLWRVSRAFSIQANYRYTIIDRSIVGESANSNRFTLWFSYEPNSQRNAQLIP